MFADPLDRNPEVPWAAGEVRPQPVAGIDGLDAGAVLAGLRGAWVRDGGARQGPLNYTEDMADGATRGARRE